MSGERSRHGLALVVGGVLALLVGVAGWRTVVDVPVESQRLLAFARPVATVGGEPDGDWVEAVAPALRDGAVAAAVVLLGAGGLELGRRRVVRRLFDRPWGGGGQSRPGDDVDDRTRIRNLLDDAGGQLRQARIVEEMPWSKAKVSRLLSGMDKEGEVVKIRLGRENLICLPDCVPDIAAAE